MARLTRSDVNFKGKNIQVSVFMPESNYTVGKTTTLVSEDNVPIVQEAKARRKHITDAEFVAAYTCYHSHSSGTYKIAEILKRSPHSVHMRALRLRDLGVRLPHAYYDRSRSRVDVAHLNRIVRSILKRRKQVA